MITEDMEKAMAALKEEAVRIYPNTELDKTLNYVCSIANKGYKKVKKIHPVTAIVPLLLLICEGPKPEEYVVMPQQFEYLPGGQEREDLFMNLGGMYYNNGLFPLAAFFFAEAMKPSDGAHGIAVVGLTYDARPVEAWAPIFRDKDDVIVKLGRWQKDYYSNERIECDPLLSMLFIGMATAEEIIEEQEKRATSNQILQFKQNTKH